MKEWSSGEYINAWASWTKNYLIPLAYDTKSLYDYWLYFSPNYEEVSWDEIIAPGSMILPFNQLNYRQYVYVLQRGVQTPENFSESLTLPDGVAIISNVMPVGANDDSSDERNKISSYIFQYMSSADYYQYTIERHNDNNYFLMANYVPNAGEIYGSSFSLQIPEYFPRFYSSVELKWPSNNTGVTLPALGKTTQGTVTKQIVDREGLIFQPYFVLMTRTFVPSKVAVGGVSLNLVGGEEIILDTTEKAFNNEIDNVSTPAYNISINNGQKILFDDIFISLY